MTPTQATKGGGQRMHYFYELSLFVMLSHNVTESDLIL